MKIPEHMKTLGLKVVDKITGFKGASSSVSFYIHEQKRLAYAEAINDAREILIEEGNKACDQGKPEIGLALGVCSKKIATLK